MIFDYIDFKKNLEKIIKIRSVNYHGTPEDTETLINVVYDDIQYNVLMAYIRQPYMVHEDHTFLLANDNATGKPDYLEATEYYTDVLDIVDERDVSLLDYIHEREHGLWAIDDFKKCSCECKLKEGDTVYFIRKKIGKIDHLEPEIYQKLMTAMTEGIMYHIQNAIPSNEDAQIGNYSYQRFFNAKKDLQNNMPQYASPHRRRKGWL